MIKHRFASLSDTHSQVVPLLTGFSPRAPCHPHISCSYSTQPHAMWRQTHDLHWLCRVVMGTGSLTVVTTSRETPISESPGSVLLVSPGWSEQERALSGEESRWSKLCGASQRMFPYPRLTLPFLTRPSLVLPSPVSRTSLAQGNMCSHLNGDSSHHTLSYTCPLSNLGSMVSDTPRCTPDPLNPLTNHCT